MPSGGGEAGFLHKLWILTDLDRGEAFVGQFVPQGLTKGLSASVPESPVVGKQNPIVQWVNGLSETVTFRARLWEHDAEQQTLEERVYRLEQLVKRQDVQPAGRPPICSFQWGHDPSLQLDACLVRSIGGITYDEVRPDGTLRGVTFIISLVRYEEVTLEVTDPSVPERFTRIRRAKRGDTYESIARDEYGDASLGPVLRRLNPRRPGMDVSDLDPLDPVHVFPLDWMLRRKREPETIVLKSGRRNEAAEKVRRDLFVSRAGDSFTTLFGDSAPDEF